MRVLVTGANGFVGRALCARLLDEGISVRALVRPGSDLGSLALMPGVEVVTGDVLSRASLAPAMRDAPWVVHLAAATAAAIWP